MRIGINMLLWTDYVTPAHFSIIDELQNVGYNGVEIPLGDGDISHYKTIGNYLSSNGMGVTCVTSLSPDTNIASPNQSVREAGLDRLKWAIDRAYVMNSEIICGPFHSAFAHFTGVPPTADEKKWSIEMLHKAGDHAQQADIILTPEALNRFECYLVNTMADLKDLLDQVNHPNVQAIYDTHHANIEEKSQEQAILTIKPHLKHVHISDNDRGTPGKGQVNWGEVFTTLKEINYDGWLMIEAFSRNSPDFANAINVWREFSETEEVYKEGFDFINKSWNN
ncbi:MAG: sugar phosphate isomerase/epimerase [Flavobacteriales bacterium]|nr:sugar phosphate isomerase/epimerase [Flavobacteriales bacterium]